jgi:hypothetical protein
VSAIDAREEALLTAYRRLTAQQRKGLVMLAEAVRGWKDGRPPKSQADRSQIARIRKAHTCAKAEAGFQQLAPVTNAKRFKCLGCGKHFSVSWGK